MEQAVAKLGAEVLDRILAAAMADPDTMCRIADDISPPTEQVQDYLTEVNTRRALFDELQAICQQYEISPHATILAVFMIAPLSELRTQLEVIRSMEQPRFSQLSGILAWTPHAIRTCTLLFLIARIFPSRSLVI